ncbi:hypothetical protein BG011_006177 [Mortierella polycephala]|uniref:C2H2-type domain-containing protein n=1 Tax=Mortierella polycephala TaxID=41804 RepID=A0A9P6QEX2_9FUNG|nr:hypothetical protein BG011_006177 [Mortierella polycephala]
MSNEGEWTTVTSKNSTNHKPQAPKPVSFASVTASTSTKPATAAAAAAATATGTTAATAQASGNNKSGNKHNNHHHHSHHHHHHHNNNKKPTRKDAAATAGSASQDQSNSTTKNGGGGQKSRSRSSSFSSDSDSSQSDYPTGSGRSPYHAMIMIHCPFQSCDMVDPLTDSTSLVAHLKAAHKICFKNIHHMFILLDRYLSHWAEEIEAKGIENVAVKEEGEEFFTIDPAVSVADRSLRDEIQREKLNEILKTQEKERNDDAKLKRKCLFCKNVCENRPILFKHMFAEHNFNIGLPDNLVNVNEFLDMLETKLTGLQCLYCEKTFTSPAVLRKHMRKKKHFKISARNRLYDQFYVINYLEPGKNWENFEHDRYDSDDDRRDDSWADWDDALEDEKTKCLFEDSYFSSAQATRDHMKTNHGFDLDGERHRLGLDFYQTVSLINYIRRQTMLGMCFSCLKKKPEEDKAAFDDSEDEEKNQEDWLVKHLKEQGCGAKVPSKDADFWKDAQFLLPMLENDPLLMIFGEEESDDEQQGDASDRSSLSDDEEGDDDDDDDDDDEILI